MSALLWFAAAWAADWPSLAQPAPAEVLGASDAALVVGIEGYLLLPGLPGARANADDWYGWLTQTRGIPLARTRILRDEAAAREQILEEAAWVAGQVGSGGTVWVVFVGHGAPAADGADGLLVGVDAQPTARSLAARSVTQGELLDALGTAERTVVVLDTTFDGRSDDGPLVPGLQPLVPSYARPAATGVVFTAGAPDQRAGPLPGVRRPAFGYLLLGALRGWGDADSDGSVTAGEAIAYTRGALTLLRTERGQVPTLSGPVEAHLSRGREREPPALAARRAAPAPAPAPTSPTGARLQEALDRVAALSTDREAALAWFSGHPESVVPGVGAFGVVLGMTVAEAADAWRDDPECELDLGEKERSCGSRKVDGVQTVRGTGVDAVIGDDGTVELLSVRTPKRRPWETPDGVYADGPVALLVRAYGPPDDQASMWRYEALGMSVDPSGDRVIRMLLQPPSGRHRR